MAPKLKLTRSRIFVCLVLLAAIVALTLSLRRSSEPVYQGKTLTEWLEGMPMMASSLHYPYDPAAIEKNEAIMAVRNMSDDAVPYLLKKLETKDSSFRRKLVAIRDKVPLVKLPVEDYGESLGTGAGGLIWLGEKPKPAIPELTRMLNDPDRNKGIVVASALRFLGRDGFQALTNGLKNPDDIVRVMVAQNFSYPYGRHPNDETNAFIINYQRDAKVAIPALVVALRDPSPYVVGQAARALGDIRLEPDIVVPALLRVANDETAGERTREEARTALADFGVSSRGSINPSKSADSKRKLDNSPGQ